MSVTEFREIPLDKAYDFRSGLSKPRSEFGSGFPFLTFKDVFDNTFVPNKLGDLVESTDKDRERCDIRRGDVFLTRTSETMDELGMSSVALRDYPDDTFIGFTKRLRPRDTFEIVPEYAAYFFRSPRFRASVTAMSSLSTRASLNNDILSSLSMLLPDRETQETIGFFLKSFDDKIDHNRQTAQTLERLARAIFKAWFVDFEPVKAKAAGATSFPSIPQDVFDALPTTFVDTEIGPVPEGWGVKALADVADFLNGLALQKYPPRDDGSDLPVIKIAQLRKGSTEGASMANEDVPEKYVIRDRDLIFSWSGTLEAEIWYGGTGALNQHLFKVTSDDYPQALVFHWIRNQLPWFRTIAASKATTMGHIKRSHLKEAKVAVPPVELRDAANDVLGPLSDLHAQMNLESRQLSEIRDYMLPKLMAGGVSVPEIHFT